MNYAMKFLILNHMKIQRQAMIEISPLEHISFSINKELSIHFDEGISIERYDWAEQIYQKKSWPIKINHMEIWLDTSSVEIFANNRRVCLFCTS